MRMIVGAVAKLYLVHLSLLSLSHHYSLILKLKKLSNPFVMPLCVMLHLCLKDGEPELLCFDDLFGTPLPLILCVQRLKSISPHICQAWCLTGAKQAPLLIRLHPMHKEVIDPEPIEEVSCSALLTTEDLGLNSKQGKDLCFRWFRFHLLPFEAFREVMHILQEANESQDMQEYSCPMYEN